MTCSFRDQYSLLREYAQELINQNSSTTVRIDVQQEPNPKSLTRTFKRVYVCLGALKQGFRACGREILRLDGCFMSGLWPGQILTAGGVDANNKIYPIAYVIVEAESKASWCWFFELTWRGSWYIHENMKSQFKGGVYKEMLYNAAKATSVGEFNKKMAELKSYNSDAYDWLMKIPTEQWSRAYFS
ncbi:mutator type transposase, partial [Tanacetum coccineum]